MYDFLSSYRNAPIKIESNKFCMTWQIMKKFTDGKNLKD